MCLWWDTGNDRVQKLSPTGTFLRAVGGPGWEDGQFNKPWWYCREARGWRFMWPDGRNRRIQVFNLNLRLLSVIGGADTGGSMDLGTLSGIAVSDADEILRERYRCGSTGADRYV